MSAGRTSGIDPGAVPKRRTGAGGFTLLELIVVLIIVGLITLIAVPRLVGSLSGVQLRTSVQKIASALRYARSRAVAERRSFVAVFDFEKRGCFVRPEKEDDEEDGDSFDAAEKAAAATQDEDGEKDEGKAYILPENVRIEKCVAGEEEFESGVFEVRFFPMGNSGGGSVLVVDEKERRYRVDIDAITGIVGLVQIEEESY